MNSTRSYNCWKVLAVISIALFMINLDVTIVNIALPDIMEELHASIASAEWVLNAYVLVFASLIITLGRMSDIFGRRLFLTGGLVIFTAASVMCGLSGNIGWLVAGRTIQAVGAAAMMPATLSILNVTFQGGQRGLAMGIWGAVAGAANALGPIIGGLLVDSFSWPAVFLVNVPLGVITVWASLRLVPESRQADAPRQWDIAGLVFSSVALAALTFGLVEGEGYGWTSPAILASFAVSVVAFVSFIFAERRHPAPLIDLKLFRNTSFSAGNALGALVMFGLIGVVFLLTLYLQIVRGYSAITTGLILMPMPGVIIFVAPFAGRLADRIPMRFVFAAGMLICAASLYLMSGITPDTTWQSLIWPLALAGVGMGLVMAPQSAVVMASAPVEKSGAASGILSMLRQVGAVLGVSVLGAVLQSSLVTNIKSYLAAAPMPEAVKAQIITAVRSAASGGGMDSMSSMNGGALSPEMSQAMFGAFASALGSAMEIAIFICIGAAALALLISYHPGRDRLSGQ